MMFRGVCFMAALVAVQATTQGNLRGINVTTTITNATAEENQTWEITLGSGPIGETCYGKVLGVCSQFLFAPDGRSCFATEALCISDGETCYAKRGSLCVMLQQKPDFISCFPTEALCESEGETCYSQMGNMCVMLQQKPDGVSCFATKELCESGGETCYSKMGNMCVLLQQKPDNTRCFSSTALCESGGATCYAKMGNMCVLLQRQSDGVNCFDTEAQCEAQHVQPLGVASGGETCYTKMGGMCVLWQQKPDGARCFATEALCQSGLPAGYHSAYDANCYLFHGANPLDNDLTAPKGLSLSACAVRCSLDSLCNCFTWRRSDGKCWKRRNCNIDRCEAGYGQYATYLE